MTSSEASFLHYFKGGEIYMKKWVAAILMVVAIVAATSANYNIG
jgi:general stress protein CsbA